MIKVVLKTEKIMDTLVTIYLQQMKWKLMPIMGQVTIKMKILIIRGKTFLKKEKKSAKKIKKKPQ